MAAGADSWLQAIADADGDDPDVYQAGSVRHLRDPPDAIRNFVTTSSGGSNPPPAGRGHPRAEEVSAAYPGGTE